MERQEAINYLNNLQKGMFCTVNLPLYGNEVMPITAMYMGKDKDGRYNFMDTGRFILSKEFIENKAISIDKKYDEDKLLKYTLKLEGNLIKRKIKKE